MKKLLLLIILLTSIQAVAQTAYYDALFCASVNPDDCDELSSSILKGDKLVIEDFKKFLSSPFDTGNPLPDFSRVRLIFSQQQAKADFAIKASGATPIQAAGLISPLLNLSSLSGSQLDTVLYGVTIYFADGFRREYLQTYMHTFDRTIRKVGELQILFPASYAKLKTFDPARFKNLGNEMKLVFDDDLSHTMPNLIKHIENAQSTSFPSSGNFLFLNQTVCQKIHKLNEYKYVKLTADVGQKLIEGVHPGNIIAHLANGYESADLPTGLADGFAVMNLLQDAMRDTSSTGNERVWLGMEKFSKLNTPLKKAYFTAILYRSDTKRVKDFFGLVSNINNTPRNTLLSSFTEYDNSFRVKLFSTLALLSKIDDYKKLKEKEIFSEQNFLPFALMVGDLIGNFIPISDTERASYIEIMKTGLKIYNAARVKNYENIPLHLNTLLNPIVYKLASYDPDLKLKLLDLTKKIDHVSAFTSGIVNAKTSEDVSIIVKQFASPSTTAVDKRTTPFSITVSGMPGLYVSLERFVVKQIPKAQQNKNPFKPTLGLSLPIGLDFSFSLAKKSSLLTNEPDKKSPLSLGLFASIIDLGAMLNYRLATNADVLPESVPWQSILSPGLTFLIGFRNTPLTLGLGYQYGPKLRKLTEESIAGEEVALSPIANTHIMQLRLSYDIPVFKLYGRRLK